MMFFKQEKGKSKQKKTVTWKCKKSYQVKLLSHPSILVNCFLFIFHVLVWLCYTGRTFNDHFYDLVAKAFPFILLIHDDDAMKPLKCMCVSFQWV